MDRSEQIVVVPSKPVKGILKQDVEGVATYTDSGFAKAQSTSNIVSVYLVHMCYVYCMQQVCMQKPRYKSTYHVYYSYFEGQTKSL